mmetsp:Transcript_15160/g.36067  ORF Transcript_15160/g.36067 Transcript_15160/m.36067 type:complete len:387 (+) Transcript_15160:132-1292(+)
MSEIQLHEVTSDAKTIELEGLLVGVTNVEKGSSEDSLAGESPGKRRLVLLQSLCYVGAFIGMGLCVGVLGPSLPYITEQLPKDANLAPAFALRGLGGLFGSFGGGWALYFGVRAHFILAAGVVISAAGVAFLHVTMTVLGVTAALISLDVGCGLCQVANTVMAWIHPDSRMVLWLNVLNGSFGVGTLIAPAAVALLATLSGSHDTGVKMALLLLPLLPVAFAAAALFVPSPTQPEVKTSGEEEGGGSWRRWAGAVLTMFALNGAVGAEMTSGGFLASYMTSLSHAGEIDAGERQADLVTSAFWLAFTIGRLGSGALFQVLAGAPMIVLWAQILTVCGGISTIIFVPGSVPAIWAGSILCGIGIAGLFAGFLGQLASQTTIDSKVRS